MIVSLTLQNFRGFDSHTVYFTEKALLVGKNNAGKSTCVEALRLVSLVTERLANLAWRSPPAGSFIPTTQKGVSPSLDDIVIHKECLFHRYGDPPALVTVCFKNGTSVDVHIGYDLTIHAIVRDAYRRVVRSRAAALEAGIPRVSILPQIGPLVEDEKRLSDDHVRRNFLTSLASLHFRNQLRLLRDEYYNDFCHRVAKTWPRLKIESLEVPSLMDKNGRVGLIIRDGDFSAEVAWMGHGLQMWLQTMWFLTRNSKSDVLILDEPDVYLHADLQRKLVRLLLSDNRQFIIATHSPEIMAEMIPENIVVLDRDRESSGPATSSKAIQQLLVQVGSVHNLSLARLAMHRRILFVEGEDVSMLKDFQNAADPSAEIPIDTVPSTDIGGWSGWPSVLTFARFLRDNAHGEFNVFCVLDRDYHTKGEIEKRIQQAADADVTLHIWSWKELENYAIVPSCIARLISGKCGKSIPASEVEEAIERLVQQRKDETFDLCAEAERVLEPKLGTLNANRMAREEFHTRWARSNGQGVVGGKVIISDLSKWSQNEFGVSFSVLSVLREMRQEEVYSEVKEIIQLVTEE